MNHTLRLFYVYHTEQTKYFKINNYEVRWEDCYSDNPNQVFRPYQNDFQQFICKYCIVEDEDE
jgi:hypothetical protein